MSKFGELIDVDIPVLLDFFTEWNEQSTAMHPVLRDVAAALGDKAKVIKIDVDKNKELAEALRVKEPESLAGIHLSHQEKVSLCPQGQ